MSRKERLIALVFLLVAGCGSPLEVPESSDDGKRLEGDDAESITSYGGRAQAPKLTKAERAIIDELGDRLDHMSMDARLFQAARNQAARLFEGGGEVPPGFEDHFLFDLRRAGGADYRISLLVLKDAFAEIGRLEEFFGQGARDWTHLGLGLSCETGGVLVAVGARRTVELAEIPMSPMPGRGFAVRGKVIAEGVEVSGAFLGLPSGSVKELGVLKSGSTRSFEIPVRFDGSGKHWLEIQVESSCGAETEVLLPLFVGTQPDPRPVVRGEPDELSESKLSERVMLELINSARSRAGLSPLKADPQLEAFARAYSKDMVALGYFGHRAPDGTMLIDRLRAKGLSPAESAENVARSSTPGRAHFNLFDSPSHRIHIMSERFTHVGIAVERDGNSVVLTQIFARW